jgi:hypothetical protein
MSLPPFSVRIFEPECEGVDMINVSNDEDRVVAESCRWVPYSEVIDLVLQVIHETREACLKSR